MIWVEAAAAMAVGIALLVLVLAPLVQGGHQPAVAAAPAWDDEELAETPKGVALLALKEIEFDRQTGKLSDEDYAELKARYTQRALEAIKAEEAEEAAAGGAGPEAEDLIAGRVAQMRERVAQGAVSCPTCGPRPESDALFCSTCGTGLVSAPAVACARCGASVRPDGRFCEACGTKVAA